MTFSQNSDLQIDLVYEAICQCLVDGTRPQLFENFGKQQWADFVKIVGVNGVAPLLYRSLKTGHAQIPDEVWAFLQKSNYRELARSVIFQETLTRLLKAFDEEAIPVMVLKGSALGKHVYPAAHLRPMSDIDLLVHEEDLSKASAMLERLDYQQSRFEQLSPGPAEVAPHHIHFEKGGGMQVPVELHWRLIYGREENLAEDMRWFWQQVEPFSPDFKHAVVLNRQANLLYLPAHLITHHNGQQLRLIWLYDLVLLLEQPADLNWAEVLAAARNLKWEYALLKTIQQVGDVFKITPPVGLLQALNEPLEVRLSQLEEGRLRLPDTRSAQAITLLLELDWPGRLRFLWGVMFPKPEFVLIEFHSEDKLKLPWFYFLRWARQLRDLTQTAVKMLFQRKS